MRDAYSTAGRGRRRIGRMKKVQREVSLLLLANVRLPRFESWKAYRSYQPVRPRACLLLNFRVRRSSENCVGVMPALVPSTERRKFVSGMRKNTRSTQTPLGIAFNHIVQRQLLDALTTRPPNTDPRAGPAPCMKLYLRLYQYGSPSICKVGETHA